MHELLKAFPVIIETPVAWGDMDAFQHVNNTVYFRYFESGRIAYFERLNVLTQEGVGPILAAAQCKFKFPLTYPDTVWIGTRITEIGDDRFTMQSRVVSQRYQRLAAEGDSVIVAYDYGGRKKTVWPEELKERIRVLEQMVAGE
ncbi:MAG: thioesterase family protein [Caldilineaceae bacterium]